MDTNIFIDFTNEVIKPLLGDPVATSFLIIICIFSILFLRDIWKDSPDSDRMVFPIIVFVFILLVMGGVMMAFTIGHYHLK